MTVAWSGKTDATQLTSITTEQFFDVTPSPDPNEVAHCEVEVDFPTTPTDNAIVSVYGTLDASTENWDDTPLLQFTISNGTDPNKVSWTIFGVYKFRVGVKRSGSTDTLTSADFSVREGSMS
jgi:hypothetical protein